MKRTKIVAACFAMGILMAGSFAAAQDAPATTSGGQVTFGSLGVKDISSAKFQEYRDVPDGLSIPFANVFAKSSAIDFNLLAYNVRRGDQRYTGWAKFDFVDVAFDYNQIPHNMGNNGHTLLGLSTPGVWSMSPTLRDYFGTTIDAMASTNRTYPNYLALFTPSLNAANSVDIKGMRKRGLVEVDFSQKLPFDLKFSYMRESKSGNRGASGGTVYGLVSTTIDVPDAMDEVVQDFGLRAEYRFKGGNIHGSFNRNLYDDRMNSLIVDNPLNAIDRVYSSSAIPSGGPSRGQFGTAPDNEASRGAFGFLLKFARQTRLSGDVALGTMTQNAPFLPVTINSTILTGTGAPASSASSFPQLSLNGKINTTMLNFGFSSRPIDGLGIRARYNSYDYADKSARFVIPGDTSGSPDRQWSAADTPSEDEPYGHATANRTSNKLGRFDAQVSYDFKPVTLEAGYRTSKSSYVGRTLWAGTDNKENGFTLAGVLHLADWLGVRGTFDQAKRTVSGLEATTSASSGIMSGVQVDHAERKQTRTGVDVELEPFANFGVTVAYFRRNDDYPNRPMKVPGDTSTTSGLLNAKYDTFTVEADYSIAERAELSGFYTFEKNLQSNRWLTLVSNAYINGAYTPTINNQLKYDGSDKGNSFGANAIIHVVPEKWTLSLTANHQKVDGNMDVTANSNAIVVPTRNPTTGALSTSTAASFYTGRSLNGFVAPQPVTAWDDTQITSLVTRLEYVVAKAWKLTVGYAYEKYTMNDAYVASGTNFPLAGNFYLKADNGNYKANLFFATIGHAF